MLTAKEKETNTKMLQSGNKKKRIKTSERDYSYTYLFLLH